jgi:hypothetical protein
MSRAETAAKSASASLREFLAHRGPEAAHAFAFGYLTSACRGAGSLAEVSAVAEALHAVFDEPRPPTAHVVVASSWGAYHAWSFSEGDPGGRHYLLTTCDARSARLILRGLSPRHAGLIVLDGARTLLGWAEVRSRLLHCGWHSAEVDGE